MSAENDSHLTLVNSAPSIEFIIEGIACRRAPFSDGELGHSILRIEHLKHRLRPGDEFPGSLQPHRGLEIVTLVLQGQFNTVCSTQHKQVMGAGHCQWMTAGRGLINAIRCSDAFRNIGGEVEIISIWINLPRGKQLSPPMYQEFDAQRIPYTYVAPRSLPFRTKPELNSESSTLPPHQQQDMPVDFAPSDISRSSSVKVISGHFGKIAGPPLSLHSDVTVLDIRLAPADEVCVAVPAGFVFVAYTFRGTGEISGTEVPLNHWGWIDSSDGGSVCIRAPSEAPLVNSPAAHGLQTPSGDVVNQRIGLAMIIIISEPLAQPLAIHGKMAMCSEIELEEAFSDYRSGKFGRPPVTNLFLNS